MAATGDPPAGHGAFAELNVELPDETSAAIELALPIARRILGGEIPEYEGASRIWHQVLERFSFEEREPDVLWPCLSRASVIDDCEADAEPRRADHRDAIAECRREIPEAAANLAGTSIREAAEPPPLG